MPFPSLRTPSLETLYQYLRDQQRLDLSYGEVGGTSRVPPAGYVVDHTRIELGNGREIFDSARSALRQWQQFRLGWLKPALPPAAIREGEIVPLLAHLMGLYWLNACRIVYVIEGEQPLPRFGFAYGTLLGHMETGEERFLIEMDDQQRVWYDILAFSRPQQLAARIAYPYVRRVQKRFGRDSAARMRLAVGAVRPAAVQQGAKGW